MASRISETARRRSAVAVALLAAMGVAVGALPIAHAQPAAASDGTREAARGKLIEGVDLMKRGDYQGALARFQEAWALVPSPKIHYDFGMAYVGLGRPADALAAFERFLAEAPDAPADKREKAAALVTTLRRQVAEASGRDDREAAPGGPPPVGPPAAASGSPPVAVSSPASTDLTARRDEPAAATAAAAADHDPARVRRITAISLGAAGVGLLAGGVVFGVLAKRESDSVSHDSEMGSHGVATLFDPSKQSRGDAYERWQIIGLVAGSVAVAAGAVLYLTTRRRMAVEPVAGPSVAGATLRLTF
jgi:hypothetical protein